MVLRRQEGHHRCPQEAPEYGRASVDNTLKGNLVEKSRELTKKSLICNCVHHICFLRQSLVWLQLLGFALILAATLPEQCQGSGNK